MHPAHVVPGPVIVGDGHFPFKGHEVLHGTPEHDTALPPAGGARPVYCWTIICDLCGRDAAQDCADGNEHDDLCDDAHPTCFCDALEAKEAEVREQVARDFEALKPVGITITGQPFPRMLTAAEAAAMARGGKHTVTQNEG